jgi:5'-nucleotidase
MRNKEIVYFDMDGVLADFAAGVHKILPGFHLGEGPDYEQRSTLLKKTLAKSKHKHIFRDLPVIDGAIEAVKDVAEHYEVYFLSTAMDEVPESYTDKFLWIRKHFGDWATKRLILSAQKDLSLGTYLIDDTTRNGAGDFTGTPYRFKYAA